MKHVCINIKMSELSEKQRHFLPLLKCEIIQFGAVMLDENYNIESTFLALVKPAYCNISLATSKITGISKRMLENAKDFVSVFEEFSNWLGAKDVSTYCWSEHEYKQIWDELSLKARHRYDLVEPLKTFVDLQKTFGDILQAKNAVPFENALQLSNCKFVGKRHTALANAFNLARILRKIATSKNFCPNFQYLYKDVERSFSYLFGKNATKSENCKNHAENLKDFINCMPEELLKGQKNAKVENFEKFENAGAGKNAKIEKIEKAKSFKKLLCVPFSFCKKLFVQFYTKITSKFLCTRYGIPIKQLFYFCIKIRCAKDFAFCKRKGYLKFLQLKSRLNFFNTMLIDNKAVI